MKNQLNIGLFMQSNENMFIQLKNLGFNYWSPNYSRDIYCTSWGKGITIPILKQLAREITPAKNLELNHIFLAK